MSKRGCAPEAAPTADVSLQSCVAEWFFLVLQSRQGKQSCGTGQETSGEVQPKGWLDCFGSPSFEPGVGIASICYEWFLAS